MSTAVISTSIPNKPPAWEQTMRRWTDYLVKDFGGGPRLWKFAWVINFQKTGTFPILAFLIAWYHNSRTAAWIYLAMHGTYGLIWIMKDLAFPDRSWQARITIGGGINAFISVLGWYWVFGWLLISSRSTPNYPLPAYVWFCLCLTLCILGVAIMIYGSFALMVWHWLPVVVLTWVWGGLFAVNIRLKEASMSRYSDWDQYKEHTWLLLPRVI